MGTLSLRMLIEKGKRKILKEFASLKFKAELSQQNYYGHYPKLSLSNKLVCILLLNTNASV
jgi:hypothetical protein